MGVRTNFASLFFVRNFASGKGKPCTKRNKFLRNGASTYENENPNPNPNKKSPCRGDLEGLEYCARTQINLRDREEVVNLLLAMTRVEMGANAAQLHELKTSAYIGYDLAATTPGFFKEIKDNR
ncbi:MAG: hypothetical protein J6W24_05285 [Prevotella sp.]|nr:hypothetical protein [Prevotella sp.]